MELNKKIKSLERTNKIIKGDLKKVKFPTGALVYVTEYTNDEDGEHYRIGMTENMNSRTSIYDTHSLHKRKVVFFKEVECPQQFEKCLFSFLYEYRYKNKSSFYMCSLETIKKAFKHCTNGLKCMKSQTGGKCFIDVKLKDIRNEATKINNKINKLTEQLL